jgi:hypothetical protein
VIAAGFIFQAKLDDAIGAGIRKWIDQDGVNDAEDGAGSANTQSEREDGSEREVRAPSEFAGGIAKVRD